MLSGPLGAKVDHEPEPQPADAAEGSPAPAESAPGPAEPAAPSAPQDWPAWLRTHRLAVGFVIVAVAARLLFWVYTDRVWEDAYITIAHTRSVMRGDGLVHHPGEATPVHGFTSALSVLIPLAAAPLGQEMTFLRLTSLIAGALSVLLAYASARRLGLGTAPTAFLLTYLALEQTQLFYGMSGMESQVAVCILLWGLYALLQDDVASVGWAAGFTLLARPDLGLWMAPAGIALLARVGWRPTLRATARALIVLLPWLVFTTAYYGTPVPNTIPAKSLYPGVGMGHSPTLSELIHYLDGIWWLFAPFNASSNVAQVPIPIVLLKLLGSTFLFCALVGAWRERRRGPILALTAFAALYLGFRLRTLMPHYFVWHCVPLLGALAVLAATGLQELCQRAPRLGRGLCWFLAIGYACHLPFTLEVERRSQIYLEEAVRAETGRFLGAHVAPGEWVALEPVGYIAYFAEGVSFADYPGLTSRRSVEALRQIPREERCLPALIDSLQPEWIVLRPRELRMLIERYPDTAVRYRPQQTFRPGPGVRVAWGGLEHFASATFIVLRRVEP
jgi:hypothetical protein